MTLNSIMPVSRTFFNQSGRAVGQGCRRKMKVSAFSKIEMSSLWLVPEVIYGSGAIAYESAGTVTFRGHAPLR